MFGRCGSARSGIRRPQPARPSDGRLEPPNRHLTTETAMEFFRISRDIPFMRHALTFNVISAVTFVLAVIFLATRGFNLGVGFPGVPVIQFTYAGHVEFALL